MLFAPWIASAADKPLYACPFLNDKSKQTLDQMEQGTDGWFFRLNRDLNRNIFITPETQEYFRRLNEALKRRGTTLIMVPIPPRSVMNKGYLYDGDPVQAKFSAEETRANYQATLKGLNDAGILTPDFFESGHSVLDLPADESFNFKRDHHWTPYGARFSAEAVAELVKKDPAYAKLAKESYETKKVGDGLHKPKMAQELQRLCTDTLPAEPYPIFQTELKQSHQTGADALFGESAKQNPVVLVGSSFSAMTEFNFEGFLLQSLGLEVSNWALAGGMQFNSITSYTSSKTFEKERPPFLIWEEPYMMDISKSAAGFLRQIIPATYGDCQGDRLVTEKTFHVVSGKTSDTLVLDPKAIISGNGYYIFADSSDLGLTKFTLQLDYDDQDGEWFTFDRSEHFDKNGRFFVELNDDITGRLKSLALDGINNVNTDVRLKVCRVPAEVASEPARTPSIPAKHSAKAL